MVIAYSWPLHPNENGIAPSPHVRLLVAPDDFGGKPPQRATIVVRVQDDLDLLKDLRLSLHEYVYLTGRYVCTNKTFGGSMRGYFVPTRVDRD